MHTRHRSRLIRAGRFTLFAAAVLTAAAAFACAVPGPAPAEVPAVSALTGGLTTTGPTPPPGVQRVSGARDALAGAGEVLLAGVPAYEWYDGCGPTSAGMLLGYYDGHGFPDLIAGDVSSECEASRQAIASHGSKEAPRHSEDYALPKDSGSSILDDRSEAPAGDEHADDSVADFMRTSRSSLGLAYGWSYTNYMGPSVQQYAATTAAGVAVTYSDYSVGSSGSRALTFALLQAEIDAGRPMVLFVDSSGDGVTDHAVLGIGYRETNGYPEYACRDTWSTGVRWSRFQDAAAVYKFEVFSGTAFTFTAVDPGVDTTDPVTTVQGADDAWHSAPVTLTFGASDLGGSGVDRIEAGIDGEALTPLAGVPATLEVSGQGVHTVTYRAVDKQDNAEAERSCTVRIDLQAPATSARAARVRHGARVTLKYRVDDVTPRATVRLVVRTLSGRSRATLRLGLRPTGELLGASWRAKLPRGRYRLWVYATDQAGNRQAAAGSARLVIR